MKIKVLPKTFTKNNHQFTQLTREGCCAIYRKDVYCGEDIPPHPVLEVICIRLSNPHPMSKEDWDKLEVYPCNERWGDHGFTYTMDRMDQAKDKLALLVAKTHNWKQPVVASEPAKPKKPAKVAKRKRAKAAR